MVKVYTRRGDDGTTGLRGGSRVRKDSLIIEVNGAADEAQAALGLARALADDDDAIQEILVRIERDLWVLMAEIAAEGSATPHDGVTGVSNEMVTWLEERIDALLESTDLDRGFAVPGENPVSAALDVARTVVRRAERLAVALGQPDSLVVAYLNRCSDLCWTLARSCEGAHRINRRDATT